MTLSSDSIQEKAARWQEELKTQRDRLGQAQAVVADATRQIAMIEGGLQAFNSLIAEPPAPTPEPEAPAEPACEMPSGEG